MAHLDSLQPALGEALERLPELLTRLFARDHTLWQEDPTEVADRLGWLDAPARGRTELAAFAREVVDADVPDVLLVGMGGSSLFPAVLADTHDPAARHPRLHVLDSTDPAAVLRLDTALDWSSTLVIAASKSGTTIETRSHLEHAWGRLDAAVAGAGERVALITDPGSPLADLGAERGVRRVFHGPPDVGGRFSALTPFGLVPAAVLGIDLAAHLDGAERLLADAASGDVSPGGAAHLGVTMAVAAGQGHDKLTLLLPRKLHSFGRWIEQLVAESSGKHGAGIVPVVDEPLDRPDAYGDDRLFVVVGDLAGTEALVAAGHPVVTLPAMTADDLGREVARWELATAVAGAVLSVNPFDQPDVAAAKRATATILDRTPAGRTPPIQPEGDLDALLDGLAPGDYLALLAFVDPDGELALEVTRLAADLRARHGVPVTVGIGPRYLHSTGQLHKGGPDTGAFVQIVGDDPADVAIPGAGYGFSTLKRAQAAGDLTALRDRGRRVIRLAPDRLGSHTT